MTDEYHKFSPRDLYDELWRGRDLEIKNLWQRSVFLSVFLILVVSGYGILFSKIFDGSIGVFHNGYYSLPSMVHLAFVVLSSLGMCLSLLWIGMAKGSKYWVECYENSIDIMLGEKWENCVFSKELISLWKSNDDKLRESDDDQLRLCHGCLGEKENDCNFLSTNGGKFSVSRINVLIGQVFFIVFIVVSFFHLSWLIADLAQYGYFRFLSIVLVFISPPQNKKGYL